MNVKGLSEYADENNYTISSSKDDIGSGPVVPAFHVEKKYEGNWVDRKRSGSGQRVCYGVCGCCSKNHTNTHSISTLICTK